MAFANERVREAYAQWQAARVLWLPSIRAGLYYGNHEALSGQRRDDRGQQSLDARTGLGMAAVGGGRRRPGIAANFRVSDAVFQPRIANQERSARQHAATATTHDLLLSAPWRISICCGHPAEGDRRGDARARQELADVTAAFARAAKARRPTPTGRPDRACRAAKRRRAGRATRVASARLAELLDLDPGRLLVPREPAVTPIDLVVGETAVWQLVTQGLSQRPELAESRHLVDEAVERLNRSLRPAPAQRALGGQPGRIRRRPGLHRRRPPQPLRSGRHGLLELRNFRAGEAAARQAAAPA